MATSKKPSDARPRRYSTSRLAREPVTIPTDRGVLTIGAEADRDKGVFRVVVVLPADESLDTHPPQALSSP